MEDNSSSYSNIDSLLRPDSILSMRSNHAGPEVDDGDSLYASESLHRPSILAKSPKHSSMTTLQSNATEVTFMDSLHESVNQFEAMKKRNSNIGKNFRFQANEKESDSILDLPLNIANEIEIVSSRIKVMQQMWDDQQEHLGRLQGEIYDLRHSFKAQSSYCSALGATLGNIIWKASREEKMINNFIELGDISELLGIASGTLASFLHTYRSTIPDVDANETQFVLSIMGIVSNIAALNEGRRFIRNDPEGKTLIELIVRFLPSVPSGSGDPLRKLLLMALYNICLDQDGLCGLYENKEFLVCIVNILNTSTPEVIILALRILEILTSGIKDLKSYLILRNNIPIETIEKLSHSSDSEMRHRAMKILKNLNDAQNKFNPKKRKNKRPRYICRP